MAGQLKSFVGRYGGVETGFPVYIWHQIAPKFKSVGAGLTVADQPYSLLAGEL
jgi:hypothetical protein